MTVLCCFYTGTVRSCPIFTSPHEGWSSLCGRSGLKKDCFLSVPCPLFLMVQAELFFYIPLAYFSPAQFNHENGGSMLSRNSGMHMQNYMMSHGQLSIVTTLRAGRSWVRILAGPRYFYVFFNVQTGCGSH